MQVEQILISNGNEFFIMLAMHIPFIFHSQHNRIRTDSLSLFIHLAIILYSCVVVPGPNHTRADKQVGKLPYSVRDPR